MISRLLGCPGALNDMPCTLDTIAVKDDSGIMKIGGIAIIKDEDATATLNLDVPAKLTLMMDGKLRKPQVIIPKYNYLLDHLEISFTSDPNWLLRV